MGKHGRPRLTASWWHVIIIIISFFFCLSKALILHGTVTGLLTTVFFLVWLPGFFLARVLGKVSSKSHPVAMFIWVIACGIGLVIPLGAVLRFFSVPVFLCVVVLHMLMLGLAFCPVNNRSASSEWHFSPRLLPLYMSLIVACGIVFVISYNQNSDRVVVYDDQTIFTGQVAWLANHSVQLHIFDRTIDLNGGLKVALEGWTYTQATWVFVSGVPADSLFIHYTAPMFTWIIPLIFFTIAYELTDNEYTATWAALVTTLFGMLTIDDLTRSISDIAFGQYALFMTNTLRKTTTAFILPLASLAMLSFLQTWSVANALPFCLLLISLFVIHPRQAGLFLIGAAATFTLRELARSKHVGLFLVKLTPCLVIMVLAVSISEGFVGRVDLSRIVGSDKYRSEVEYILANPVTVYGKYTILENIPLIGTTPILYPSAIFYHVIVVLAVSLGLLQLIKWRRSFAQQYIFATTVSSLILAFMPGVPEMFFHLFGLNAGRFLVGLVFIIPIPLILAISLESLLSRLATLLRSPNTNHFLHTSAAILLSLIVLLLLFEPFPIAYSARDQMDILHQLKEATLFHSYDQEMLSKLITYIPIDNSAHVVIAPGRLSAPLVESVPQVLITTGRSENRTYKGTQRFFNESTSIEPWFDTDDTVYFNSLNSQDIYIIAEASTTRLAQLLMQPNRFRLLDATPGGYFIFHIDQKLEPQRSENIFKEMNALYSSIAQPRWTGNALELHRSGDAIHWRSIIMAWQEELHRAADDPIATYGLAFTYLMMGDDSQALPLWISLHQQFPDLPAITDALAYTQQHLGMDRQGADTLLNTLSSSYASVRIMAVRGLLSEPFFYLLSNVELSRVISETRSSSDAWQHLSGYPRERISLVMSRDLWDVAVEWFNMIPSTELSAKDWTARAVALLAQGQVEQAINQLQWATDTDWLAPKVFVHPDRWNNNIAAQTYYLLKGEIALREKRFSDAENNYQQAIKWGNTIAAHYFLSTVYQASAQVTAAQEQLSIAQKEWNARYKTPLPDLVSLLAIADNKAVYVIQPQIVRGSNEDEITLKATYGSSYGEAYSINKVRLTVYNLDRNAVYISTEETPVFLDGALVRLTSVIKLREVNQLPSLTQGRLYIDPLYNNRVVFGSRFNDVTLHRPSITQEDADSVSINAHFGSEIILKSYKVTQSSSILHITLYWLAVAPPVDNFHVFVHIVDKSAQLIYQVDGVPLDGRYPTNQWRVGTVFEDTYTIPIAQNLGDGEFIRIGMYRLSDMVRLPLIADGYSIHDNTLQLYEFNMKPG